MPAQLLALTDGPNILLDKPILLIGRHPECDILIESRKISRRHCCIAQVSDYLVVRDLGSTNGIRINGVRILEGRLRAGDELTIGNSRYRVRWDPLEAGSPPARDSAAASSPVRQPRREAARPGLPARFPDELLEGFDDPVPLEESDVASVPLAHGPAPKARPASPPAADGVSHPILPDNLELAPPSDVFPPPSSQPPP